MPIDTVRVDLAARLYAADDLLGWTAPLLLRGMELELRFPREPSPADWDAVDDGDVPYLRGPEGCDSELEPPSHLWGVSFTRLEGAEINSILVSGLDRLPAGIDMDLVLRHLALWSGRFIGWLNAGAGEIVAERRAGGRSSLSGSLNNVVVAHDPRKQRLRAHFIASAVATTGLVRRAVSKANAELDVPLPWAIWDDAEHSAESDPRRAVIDACTAAEAGIESRLARISGLPGVVAKASAYNRGRRLGRLTVERIKRQLAAPRNRAAHSGVMMTRTEALQALEASREVLHIVNPGDAHLSSLRSE